MATPSEDTRPLVKVNLGAPVYMLYEDAWLELGLPAPLLTKMSARAAGAQRPDMHSAQTAKFRCFDIFFPS